jgi:putative phosphoesterase
VSDLEPLTGTRFGVIADAHIHPGKTPPFPEGLLDAFRGVDGIIALGDMGETSGLDLLARLAPVYAVAGEDDAAGDARINGERRLFSLGGLAVGAVFSGVKHGLFASSDPLSLKPDFVKLSQRCFGRKLAVLLCASTHKPFAEQTSGVLIVNPGSPTLADKRTVALLDVTDGSPRAQHVEV